ncbi:MULTISPECIES: hypothetical protein [unclassified Mesorhizobium]|uniref:hypothetical protein n=1 Tax=unclassified Mesorhizobium TaxID=325217 RepID=UPI001ACEB8DE|nr:MULTISPECIES: hypothetical protein [unclassified Mesorhizobium]MBN9255610.1 hypothetical protein [Mesorhizobium sp.]
MSSILIPILGGPVQRLRDPMASQMLSIGYCLLASIVNLLHDTRKNGDGAAPRDHPERSRT